jgi:hypothetical protein
MLEQVYAHPECLSRQLLARHLASLRCVQSRATVRLWDASSVTLNIFIAVQMVFRSSSFERCLLRW